VGSGKGFGPGQTISIGERMAVRLDSVVLWTNCAEKGNIDPKP